MATRHKLFLNHLRYVGPGDINMAEDVMIKALAKRIEAGDLQLVNLSGAGRAPGPTEKRKYTTPAAAKVTQRGPEIVTASQLLAQKKKPERDHKIVVEIAGTGLTGCCADRITTSQVKPDPSELIDPKHLQRVAQSGEDEHRYETEIDGITQDRRWVWLDPGCNDSDDACYPIPLKEMDPVSKDAQEAQWPTVLVPLVPLAYTDVDNTPERAYPLRSGWLHIYVNGHIWRELYCFGDNTFRDVNLALPSNAGKDVREPTGHKVSTVLVPHKIDDDVQEVSIAFSEVQWTWHTICAMGGPADDDPRFLPKVISSARKINVDSQRHDKRFVKLDFSGYPDSLDGPDGIVKSIDQAPCADIEDEDPIKVYRDKKIAAVYLEDPLLVARYLAADYQQSWRDMEALLKELAQAPEKAIKEKTYEPGRWFESAILANQFFFSAFPTFEQWQQLHPESDRRQWQKAKGHRDEMQSRLDKQAIEEALGVERRNEMRPKIDDTKQALVDYLTSRTKDEMDLLMLMIDDYFLLPNAFGTENQAGKNPCGYVDGWLVVEQLIARLADHSHTMDVDLQTEPANTHKLTQEDKGVAFINTLADPDQNHPLHARLFPKPGSNAWTPDTAATDLHALQFKPQQFEKVPAEEMLPISVFASHFAKSALIPEGDHVQQSIVRLTNCALKLELAFEETDFETVAQHAEENALPPEETQEQIGKALKGELTTSGCLALMRRIMLFIKGTLERGDELADDAAKNQVTVKKDIYSDGRLPAKATFDPELKKGYKVIEESVDGKSCVVKRPFPGADKGVIHLPEEGLVGLKVLDPNGKIIGRLSIDDFRTGKMSSRQWSKIRHNTPWQKTKVELIISRDPGLFARFNKLMENNKLVSHVVVPLVVMFETWNVYHSGKVFKEKIGTNEATTAWVDLVGASADFAALSAAIVHTRIGVSLLNEGVPKEDLITKTPFKVSGAIAGGLGVIAGAYSTYQSGRDMIANINQGDDAAIGHAVMLAGFGVGTFYYSALTVVTVAGEGAESAFPLLVAIAEGPLVWISLGIVLAGMALLMFVFKEDTPLEEWLQNGPFSIRKVNIPVTQNSQNQAGFGPSKGLIVDQQGTLTGIEKNSFLKQDGNTVYYRTIKGRQVLGTIGQPFDSSVLNDPSGRFAGHQPGDVAWEVPEGWIHKYTPRPGGSREKKEFIKTPKGSHLWISLEGVLEDSYTVPGDALYNKVSIIYLKTNEAEYLLGRPGQPIRNKKKLFVDHKDDGDHFRDWCEKPRTAHLDLAAAIYTPQLEVSFTRSRITGYNKPSIGMEAKSAESYKGYSSTAHLQVAIPHFVEGKSKLYVEVWEHLKRRDIPDPQLAYKKEIVLKSDPQKSLNLISIDWPLISMDQRYTWVTIKVRLDLYGDDSLCLPLNRQSDSDDFNGWLLVETYADRDLNPESK